MTAAMVAMGACSTAAPAATPGPATSSAEAVASIDIAWARLQTALDERVLIVLELVPDRSQSVAVRALAESLRAQYQTQIRQLGDALVRVGATEENPHTSHDMPGMATAETLAALRGSHGPEFDHLLVSTLAGHIDQSVSLATSFATVGRNPTMLGIASLVRSTGLSQRTQLNTVDG